jgi:hypothetical protein
MKEEIGDTIEEGGKKGSRNGNTEEGGEYLCW